jgi:hypothetical protein
MNPKTVVPRLLISARRRLAGAGLMLLAGAAGLGLAWPAHALYNPPIRMAQGIEYMSGGVGSEEAAFMEMVAPRWAATLAFGVKGGKPADFGAEVKVQVRDAASGSAVLDVSSTGPFMMLRLAPGSYQVEVTLAGQTVTQPLTVQPGEASRAQFEWATAAPGTHMAADTR